MPLFFLNKRPKDTGPIKWRILSAVGKSGSINSATGATRLVRDESSDAGGDEVTALPLRGTVSELGSDY